jgi:RimJ/RimL family protein N-acetyltransferase
MTDAPELATSRLRLRAWNDRDLSPFAALNADPRVTEFFPRRLERAESDALVAHFMDHFARHGFGFWAVEAPGVAEFVGFVGLAVPTFQAAFTPCVEIGWRLAPAYWGRGYASEGARAALAFGFGAAGLDEIVSFTVPDNLPSRRVMGRLGMRRSPADDFQHPALPEGHPLRAHVLYRLTRAEWQARAAGVTRAAVRGAPGRPEDQPASS